MNRRAAISRLAAPLTRLILALFLTAAQSALAAHVHDIRRPAGAVAMRRADALDAHAQCPVCRLAGHARAAAAASATLLARPTRFVVRASRAFRAASAPIARADARGPPDLV